MTELIERKKEEKRKNLLDVAYKLFLKQGVSATSIAQICKEAGIAKGTFYLYFQDKEDILASLTRRISYHLIEDAYSNVPASDNDFVKGITYMIDWLIDMFHHDQEILKLLHKDFIWPISEEDFLTSKEPVIISVRERVIDYAKQKDISVHCILFRLYSLISMVCAVSYSYFIDGFPKIDLDDLKKEVSAMVQGCFLLNN